MAHVQWKERDNINDKEIDDQPKGLVDILNRMVDLLSQMAEAEQIGEIFHRLRQ